MTPPFALFPRTLFSPSSLSQIQYCKDAPLSNMCAATCKSRCQGYQPVSTARGYWCGGRMDCNQCAEPMANCVACGKVGTRLTSDNVATYQKITAAEGAMSLKGAGWCSAGSNQEWKGRRFTGNPAACKAKCESEATCIGYWQYVHPSPSAGTCTMFATSGYLSGTGFSTKYDRNGRGNAASAADFILAHTSRTNLECWTKTYFATQ